MIRKNMQRFSKPQRLQAFARRSFPIREPKRDSVSSYFYSARKLDELGRPDRETSDHDPECDVDFQYYNHLAILCSPLQPPFPES
jgi:hypothetical protein